MKNNINNGKLKVAEIFYSIQGEGSTAGRPRLFIRTSGCSLKCLWCDTKYHIKGREMTKREEVMLRDNQDWCITGGEPLLRQKELGELIKKYSPFWVEVETNGTIVPTEDTMQLINRFNVSPKEPRFQPQGVNPEPFALRVLDEKSTIVKFVYSDQESKRFISKIIKKYNIPNKIVWLMPEGVTKKEIEAKTKEVWAYCLKKGYNFSPRLQVVTFGKKKGI